MEVPTFDIYDVPNTKAFLLDSIGLYSNLQQQIIQMCPTDWDMVKANLKTLEKQLKKQKEQAKILHKQSKSLRELVEAECKNVPWAARVTMYANMPSKTTKWLETHGVLAWVFVHSWPSKIHHSCEELRPKLGFKPKQIIKIGEDAYGNRFGKVFRYYISKKWLPSVKQLAKSRALSLQEISTCLENCVLTVQDISAIDCNKENIKTWYKKVVHIYEELWEANNVPMISKYKTLYKAIKAFEKIYAFHRSDHYAPTMQTVFQEVKMWMNEYPTFFDQELHYLIKVCKNKYKRLFT